MKKIILCLFITTVLFINNNTSSELYRYRDDSSIPPWALPAVEILKQKDIMTGHADGYFRPNDTITRAESLVLLFRMLGIEEEESTITTSKFSDVKNDQWFAKSVFKAVEKEWVNGYSDGTFRPGNKVNKAEFAKLLNKAFNIPFNPKNIKNFADLKITDWFYEDVQSLYNKELLRFPKSKNFVPNSEISRVEVAWILAEIINKEVFFKDGSINNGVNSVNIDSKTVSIVPPNFDYKNQGLGKEVIGALITIDEIEEKLVIKKDSTNPKWLDLGILKIKNTAQNTLKLNLLDFTLRFENDLIGPADKFEMNIASIKNDKIDKTITFSSKNNIILLGLNYDIYKGKSADFSIKIRPIKNAIFLSGEGKGTLSIDHLEGLINSTSSIGRQITYKAPIDFINRNFTTFDFQ